MLNVACSCVSIMTQINNWGKFLLNPLEGKWGITKILTHTCCPDCHEVGEVTWVMAHFFQKDQTYYSVEWQQHLQFHMQASLKQWRLVVLIITLVLISFSLHWQFFLPKSWCEFHRYHSSVVCVCLWPGSYHSYHNDTCVLDKTSHFLPSR